ncbi:putative type II secretion system protein E [Novipirellula aureliae]|uniref:Putative type II secretion system protein E n=2 Tax=Novipirellula aureliae TaxID=2527966 RepID=A0A5C6DF05_9BACT|nr:putative type II secretion system protein E [Novipirellula aureliae]
MAVIDPSSCDDGFSDLGFAVLLPPKELVTKDSSGGELAIENFEDIDESVAARRESTNLETAKSYAKHYLLPLFDPPADQPLPIRPGIGDALPQRWCYDHRVAPLSDDGETIEVAIVMPDSLLLADEVRTLTGRQMRPFFAPTAVVDRLLHSLYPISTAVKLEESLEDDASCSVTDQGPVDPPNHAHNPLLLDSPSSSIRALPEACSSDSCSLSRILLHLAQGLVEQILIEPNGRTVQIRARHGGGLYELETLSRSAGKELLSQVLSQCGWSGDASTSKIVASGQTGEFRVRIGERRIPIRATFCPTVSGVMVTLIRGKTASKARHLNEIGLQTSQFDFLQNLLRKKSGLILISGKRRSGKTTTFYSLLEQCKTPATHVCTIEDAVTVDLDGINQVSLCDLPGLSRVDAMDLISMQLPDVIGIDRLNDAQTANTAIQMAAEGALVIATLACRDGLSAAVRMKQLGVDPSTLSSLLLGTLSQKRYGRLCVHCRRQASPPAEIAEKLNMPPNSTLAWPRGCPACGNMGYKGSVVVFDVFAPQTQSAAAIGLPSAKHVLWTHVVANEISSDAALNSLGDL